MIRRLAVIGGFAALALAFAAPQAHAHALLASSQPADGAQLASAPSEVVLSFTEAPDAKLSTIRVLDTSGAPVSVGSVTAVSGRPKDLRVALATLPDGVYTVTWRTVSRVDGHVTGGAFAFGVGRSPEGVKLPAQRTPSPSALSVGGRALYYAGIVLLIGAVIGARFLFADARPQMAQLARSGLTLAIVGLFAFGEAQRRAASVTIGAFARSSLGHAVAWRGVPLLLAIVALVMWRARAAVAFTGVAVLGSIVAHIAAGHAGDGRLHWLKIALQSVHVEAVGVWIGGLVALLAGMRSLPPEVRMRAVRRFSTVAAFMLAAVAGTGIARAIDEVGSLHQLTASTFGQLVIAKSALLLALLGLGALNRYRSVPVAGVRPSLLERVSRTEIAIATVVLVLTGILSGVTPGRSFDLAARARPKPLVVTGADFGTTVRLRLAVAPGTPGRNTFTLHIRDYDSGAPVVADRVSLRFTFLDDALTGGSQLPLKPAAPGIYTAAGTDLSLDGRWRVTAVIERGVHSVEVPLEVQTRSPPQQIQIIPGDPTLYTITLSPKRSVQMYISPGASGANELHATFFLNGGASPGITDVRFTAALGTGAPAALPFRTLDVGHFVADAKITTGKWTFAVRATAPDGARMQAHFEQEIR